MSKLKLPDPYEISENDAQEMLEKLQTLLWADENGEPDPDREWDSETLGAIGNILEPLAPRTPKHEVRQITYRVSVLTIDREETAAYTPVQLAQLIIAQDAAKQAGVRPYHDFHVEAVDMMTNKELSETEGAARLKAAGREVSGDDEG